MGCRRAKGIREWDAIQLVALALQPGLLRERLETALPGRIGRIKDALECMAGDTKFFTVIRQEVPKGFRGVEDAILGVQLDLANGPIPDAGQMPEPPIKLVYLTRFQAEFELALDHAKTVSVVRYIA